MSHADVLVTYAVLSAFIYTYLLYGWKLSTKNGFHTWRLHSLDIMPASLWQELKGNIRVFARVRPAGDDQAQALLGGEPVVAFPAGGRFPVHSYHVWQWRAAA